MKWVKPEFYSTMFSSILFRTENSFQNSPKNPNFYAFHFNWTPGRGRKGPMNQGLSVHPSGSFLETGSLVFSETQHGGVKGPCVAVRDNQIF